MRFFIYLTKFLICCIVGGSANAQFKLSLVPNASVGYSQPKGNIADEFNSGYQFNVGTNVEIWKRFQVGIMLGRTTYKSSNTLSLIEKPVGLRMSYYFTISKIRPFVLVGIGRVTNELAFKSFYISNKGKFDKTYHKGISADYKYIGFGVEYVLNSHVGIPIQCFWTKNKLKNKEYHFQQSDNVFWSWTIEYKDNLTAFNVSAGLSWYVKIF